LAAGPAPGLGHVTFHKSGHKSDDHASNREDKESSLIFTNFNKFKFIDLTLLQSVSSSVKLPALSFSVPEIEALIAKGVSITMAGIAPMKHIDRDEIYTNLESRIQYLHSFLDFTNRM